MHGCREPHRKATGHNPHGARRSVARRVQPDLLGIGFRQAVDEDPMGVHRRTRQLGSSERERYREEHDRSRVARLVLKRSVLLLRSLVVRPYAARAVDVPTLGEGLALQSRRTALVRPDRVERIEMAEMFKWISDWYKDNSSAIAESFLLLGA